MLKVIIRLTKFNSALTRSFAVILSLAVLLTALASCDSPDIAIIPTPNETSPNPSWLPIKTPTPYGTSRETVTEDGKNIIYIGSFSSGSQEIEDAYNYIKNSVGSFNLTSPEYEARVIDYGIAYEIDSLYRLNADILGGIMPDILITHGMPVDSYQSKGLLYNMDEWIDSKYFYSGPLESMRAEDGGLYNVSPLFTVTTFYGLTKYVGESGTLSFDDLRVAWEQFVADGGKSFISGVSNEFICLLMVDWFENEFVDRTNAVCDFGSPKFIELLEFCKSLPSNPSALNVNENIGLESYGISESVLRNPELHYANAVRTEKSLLGVLRTPRYWGFVYPTHWMVKFMLSDVDYRYIGVPGANTGSVFMDVPFSVSAHPNNLDIVKIFVDKLWTRKEGNDGKFSVNYFPLKRSVMESVNQSTVVTGETGIFGYVENMLMWFSSNPDIPIYTMSDFTELEEIVSSSNVKANSPLALYMTPLSRAQVRGDRFAGGFEPNLSIYLNSIIYDELHSFFGGAQDAKRTAELIQTRYTLYLQEQQ
jgi:hypothetical protein